MADVNIILKIPSTKVTKALEGFLKIYPNVETMNDPKWIEKEGEEAPQVAKYTNKQWAVEQIRRLVVRDIGRGHQMIANEIGNVPPDDGMVTSS